MFSNTISTKSWLDFPQITKKCDLAEDFILSSGAQVADAAKLIRCFVGQACHLGHNYSASDSLFFSNCQGENGEACAIFAGPFTVTHHKSTLLIAGLVLVVDPAAHIANVLHRGILLF